ncbi:hypothetical protein [Variovorax sp. KK3]|uniref:hypothetical protein n=1 Tax=Variovorax sp. KK3 TaxID=1855728 RepID=UPI00097C7F93|nr:hypothetical protein [Variovorax sp. KK3]
MGNQLEKRDSFSNTVLTNFREALAGAGLPSNCAVVINGSLARREASDQSDVDYFVLYEGKVAEDDLQAIDAAMARAITAQGLRPPATHGAFAKPESIDNFLLNVGGDNDPNHKLTRRMLFMLEGEWLTQRELFERFRARLIQEVYTRQELRDDQLARFFLNDLIRYWRTIGVDFEFKTHEAGKAWGTRNLKLAFSRKLLYFSGLLMAAETAQRTVDSKIEVLRKLSAMTPIQRIREIFQNDADKALRIYEEFLERLSDADFRKESDAVTQDCEQRPASFQDLKNRGQHFSWELDRLLRVAYGPRHPIHHALVF